MKKGPAPENTSADDKIVVSRSPFPKIQVLAAVIGCVLVVAVAGISVWFIRAHNDNASADDDRNRKALVGELSTAVNHANQQSIIGLSSQLIDGAKRYKLGNDDLGWYYIDRANAYSTLGKNGQATPDYEKAASLNDSLKTSALEGEFEARYETGERSQLIPLLQTIVQREKDGGGPMGGSEAARYQSYIQLIKQGKEISF